MGLTAVEILVVDECGHVAALMHDAQDDCRAIRRIEPLHDEFDPELHEAIGHIPSDDVPADHVAVVTQAGYAEDGKLLRPARVLVSSGPVAAGVGGAQTTR